MSVYEGLFVCVRVCGGVCVRACVCIFVSSRSNGGVKFDAI